MPDEENPPEVPEPEPLNETVESTKERIRRSRSLLHRIDALLKRRKSPKRDDDS